VRESSSIDSATAQPTSRGWVAFLATTVPVYFIVLMLFPTKPLMSACTGGFLGILAKRFSVGSEKTDRPMFFLISIGLFVMLGYFLSVRLFALIEHLPVIFQ
jgi:hypothetical protein